MNRVVVNAFDQFNQHIRLTGSERRLGFTIAEKLSKALERDSAIISCMHFGSFARSTAIRRFSDVDLLVEFERSRRVESTAPEYLLSRLEDLARGVVVNVRRHQNAVTLLYPEWPTVDIVPAMRYEADKKGEPTFLVPATEGKQWQVYRPYAGDRRIEQRAQSLGDAFKGSIRMMKWWSKIKGGIIESFEIERLACDLFVEPMPAYPQAICAFFDSLASKPEGDGHGLSPVHPPGFSLNASVVWDEARQIAHEALRLSGDLERSSQKAAIVVWRKLFGEQFPRAA